MGVTAPHPHPPTHTLHWTQYTITTPHGNLHHICPNGGILYRDVTNAQGDPIRRTIQQQAHHPLVWGKDIFMDESESFFSTMADSLPLKSHNSGVRAINK